MFSAEYLHDQNALCENRLPARSQLLPSSHRGVTWKNFTDSDRIRLLSGTWKFKYCPSEPENSFAEPDHPDGSWDELAVPSVWQYHGYGCFHYPNTRYCFPYDPPYIHRDNPVGLYRLKFRSQGAGKGRAILRFLGVDNVFAVWLNGEYVGFSKGSRIPAEFDVTQSLRDGENLLAVKVYSFSDASYLEDQDMLLASGIFRDVMLIFTGENSLWDYTVIPREDGFGIKYVCRVGGAPCRISFTLCGADGAGQCRVQREISESGEVFLPVKDPVFWNAEAPYLYRLFIELEENGGIAEVHTKDIGIALSKIEGARLLMNGVPITLKGVNRHEYNARTGRTVGPDQILTELRDIKACNLNAIRCSHYTNHPLFYELASELGIYVMDEADCESHGAGATGDEGALNKDPAWEAAFMDRTQRMYYVNKNETCVNIRSLGNECGSGGNWKKCLEWLLAQDVKKPVKDTGTYFPDEPQGFVMTGYMPMKTLLESSPDAGKPLMMLEYAHAMGNGPGGLEDIWDWVYENPHCCGGYVWEYKNHGFYAEGRDGRARYLHGDDCPDEYNFSNFSLDGYHLSDGSPKPVWNELREVSAPVHVRWTEEGAEVKNTLDFTALKGVILRWSVRADGRAVRSGEIYLDGLAPRARRLIPISFDTAGLTGTVTADCEFFSDGKLISHKQKIIGMIPVPSADPAPFEHTVHRDGDCVTVDAPDFSARFVGGLLSRLAVKGVTVVDSPVKLNCMRAYTDNDGIPKRYPRLAGEWDKAIVGSLRFGCRRVSAEDAADRVTVRAEGRFLPPSRYWGFDTVITYTVTAGGAVGFGISMKPYGRELPRVLPRVGVVFELAEDLSRCRWIGRGPDQNYPDLHAAAPVGEYEGTAKDMNFLFDVPQETGLRCDCRTLTVTGERASLKLDGSFAFALQDFTLESLNSARHRDELDKCRRRYLYVDYRHRGLGSNSCGPDPEEPYELPVGEFNWSFSIRASLN